MYLVNYLCSGTFLLHSFGLLKFASLLNLYGKSFAIHTDSIVTDEIKNVV